MARALRILFLILVALVAAASGYTWDLESDTWVATDSLGRHLPGYAECGGPKSDKTAGMFYFLWLGQHGTGGPYDITKLLAENPTNPAWGPEQAFHHWGESELGYYLSNDQYVIKKHCQMLVDMGIDVIIFDVTNGYPYTSNYKLLCGIYQQIRNEGGITPQVCFLCNPDNNSLVQNLYNNFYSKNLYPDLWYRWLGKPLILTKPDGLSSTLQNFFTFRRTWAWNAGTQDNWTWLDHYPQVVGWHTAGVPEEISVTVAQHPVSNIGRSFHDGAQPAPGNRKTEQGLCFAEQWRRALEVSPPFVFITGWNEWVAQRFISDGTVAFLGQMLPVGGTYFVDTYIQEYSRDIEPMKGGHTDNYYYQAIANIRKYKGVRQSTPPSAAKTIVIDGNFSDWDDVAPEYRDTIGDTIHRNSVGWGSAGTYINNTGRNDFVKAKTARDNDYIYFYVETNENITAYTDPNWMLLFIDTDCEFGTGWNGYDCLVNYPPLNSTITSLKRNAGGWNWYDVCEIPYIVAGKKMEMRIPRSSIMQTDSNVAFDFHWADNIQTNDIIEFSISGDSAPNRRFNYRYATVNPGPQWEFNTDGDAEGWTNGSHVSNLSVSNGCIVGDISGSDPYVTGPRYPDIDASANRYVHVRMKTNAAGPAQIYWQTQAEPSFSDARHLDFPITADGQMRDYFIDMAVNAQWTGTVNTLRLDPSRGASNGHFEVDFIRVCLKWEDDQPPSIPTNVACDTLTTSSIEVTWTASTDNMGVTGYRIYRNGDQAGTTAQTSYTDTGLSWNTIYSYTVSAYDAHGNESAQSSPPATDRTLGGDTTPPSVPTNVTATALSTTSVQLAWTASTDNVEVKGYYVYRNGNYLATSTTTTFTNNGLTPNTVYSYTVAAYDASRNVSAQSSPPATAKTLSDDTQPPSVPTDVSVTAQTPRQVKVTWTASTDNVEVTGYKNYRNGVQIGTSAATSHTDTGLSPDITYSYTVLAYDSSDNNSDQSSPPATVMTMTAIDIDEAKELADTFSVGMVSKIVTAIYSGCLYIEETSKHMGMKVVPLEMPGGLSVGSIVDIGGTMQTGDNERYLANATIEIR